MVPAKISTGKRARVSWRIVGKQEVIGLFPLPAIRPERGVLRNLGERIGDFASTKVLDLLFVANEEQMEPC
jgi:hypothetical protein